MVNPNYLSFYIAISIIFLMAIICYKLGVFPKKIKRVENNNLNDQVSFFVNKICNNIDMELFVVGGECNHNFWNHNEVIDVLNNLINNKITINICSGPWFDVESVRLAKLINDGKVNYYMAKDREENIHFWGNDVDTVACHPGNEQNKEVGILGSRYINRSFKKEFLNKIIGITPIEKGRFIDNFKIKDPLLRDKHKSDFWFTNTNKIEPATQYEIDNLSNSL